MINPKKNINALNPKTNKIQSLTVDTFNSLNQNPHKPKFKEQGFTQPEDVLACWHINEDERIRAIKDKKPFCENYSTSLYFNITKRIDNNYLEGYIGSQHFELKYFDRILEHQTYFKDYVSRDKVYFSFDKISLFKLMEIIPGNPLKLILKRIDSDKYYKTNCAFMIMPFHNKVLDEFYYSNIKKFLKDDMNIEIYRADDFRDNDIIIQTIYNQIEQSEFIIAETTIENKNVFYELGYASACGKEIITVQNKQIEQKLFFDRAHIRSILYNNDDIASFQFNLRSTIQSIRSRI